MSLRAKMVVIVWGLVLSWLCCGAANANGLPLAGKVIHLNGQVTIRSSDASAWNPAQINQDLFTGDAVQTGPASRAAILCVDETQIKLHENTFLVLHRVVPSPRLRLGEVTPAAAGEAPLSSYQVIKGEIWLRNKNEQFPFELETPSITAGLRGTEFNVQVAADGTTRITLLEGRLDVRNPYGALVLTAGEEAVARVGEAPTKRLLVQPDDAVQWALYYPGILSYRDLPLADTAGQERPLSQASGISTALMQAEASYDRGQLGEARQEALSVLKQDPGNDRALTVLGWLSLQEQEPKEALSYFRQVRRPSDRTAVGLALALYRLGDASQAYATMQAARRELRPTPLMVTMTGFFALMVGRVEEARGHLQTAMEQAPNLALPRALLAQINVVQNRKQAARSQAAQALALAPSSPLANLTMALVNIAFFELPEATRHLTRALELDHRFVDAYVYLAKIWLGGDYLDRAGRTVEQALKIAPNEAEVLALAGFVRLGHRDYPKAKELFTKAVAANPGVGEPHLGLGHYYFRYREPDRGLTEILTATLLEPRVSLYQSFLGKALYQMRSFTKSLEIYDYAKTLDPKDPTPFLYKGIALTDLYRPGEAVQEFNKSIELNDNRAVFRSRLMLDRDLAVRNVSLAQAYGDLGLDAWAQSKAITAVKYDPIDSSAQLFFYESFINDPQRQPAAFSADLFYRLLSPANQNTFMMASRSNEYTPDYTPMFEMPYLRVPVETTVGFWDGANSFQNVYVEPYGGWPGLGLKTIFGYGNTLFSGWRDRNSRETFLESITLAKWDATPKDSFFASFEYDYTRGGDNGGTNNTDYQNDPYFHFHNRGQAYEVGYVHRFSPNATLLGYFNYQNWNPVAHRSFADTFLFGGLPIGYQAQLRYLNPVEFVNVQAQQQIVLGPHTLMFGADYLSGHFNFKIWGQETFFIGGTPVFSTPLNLRDIRRPERAYTFYVMDYWRLRPNLLLELGLFKETVTAPYPEGRIPLIYETRLNPRIGLNWYLNLRHTLRLGWSRHLDTHQNLHQAFLQPLDTAGFARQTSSTIDGSRVELAGASWEAQWDDKTFSVLRLEMERKITPTYRLSPERFDWRNQRNLATFILNRILTPSVGLAAGMTFMDFDDNWPGRINYDFTEINGFARLTWVHRTGFKALVESWLIQQDLKYRGDNLFGLVNLGLRKDFPKKRGYFLFRVDNLFNRPFNYEPVLPLGTMTAKRRFLFALNLQF
jgi:tetratricopeptide (TPR) repeat protein